jgi:hypothetical protein
MESEVVIMVNNRSIFRIPLMWTSYPCAVAEVFYRFSGLDIGK